MTYPDRKGRSLVSMANEGTLIATSTIIGDEDGPPRWVLCIADGNDKRAASRVSVVRAAGEDCTSLWARVLSAIRQLKEPRGIMHPVRVLCMHSEPPKNPAQFDSRFNIMRALWLEADHNPDPDKRVRALGMLADVVNHRGDLPTFQ